MEWQDHYNHRFYTSTITRNIPSDHFVIFISGSYGDIFPNLCLIDSFIKIRNANVVLVLDRKWRELVSRFHQPMLKWVFIDNESQFKASLMAEGRPFYLKPGFVFPTLPTLHPFLAEAATTERMSDYEVKRLLLGLPVGEKMRLQKLSSERLAMAKNLIIECGCRLGKTVVLSFGTNSNKPIPQEVQQILADQIAAYGFDILINGAKTFEHIQNQKVRNYPTANIPPDMPIEFIEAAGYHAGSIHGLSVILATFPCKSSQFILYDLTEEFTSNNGMQIRSDSLFVTKRFKEDIVSDNILCEYGYRTIDDIGKAIDLWLKNLIVMKG